MATQTTYCARCETEATPASPLVPWGYHDMAHESPSYCIGVLRSTIAIMAPSRRIFDLDRDTLGQVQRIVTRVDGSMTKEAN